MGKLIGLSIEADGGIQRTLCGLTLGGLLVFFGGCQSPSVEWLKPKEQATLGDVIYDIAHQNLADSGECPEAKLRVLERRRAEFIWSVNRIISEKTLGDFPDTVEQTLLPLVDSGALARLSDSGARMLRHLVDVEQDPDHEALSQMLAVKQARTVLTWRDMQALTERVINFEGLSETVHSIAELARVDHQGAPFLTQLMGFLGGETTEVAAHLDCKGLTPQRTVNALLNRVNPFPKSLAINPAWAVYADVRSNPEVAINPRTGTLYAPFLDEDQDGVADTDERGDPIDASGQNILLPTFGRQGMRDSFGRSLAKDGQTIYRYFDAVETTLSYLLQLIGEALDAGIQRDLVAILDAVLLPQNANSGDNPIADIIYAVMEDLHYERIGTLLRTWDVVMQKAPALAESVFLTLGKMAGGLGDQGFSLSDDSVLDTVMGAMPLVADLFQRDNSTGLSTARLLLDVFHQLSRTARSFPARLATNMEYISVVKKGGACSDSPVDFDSPLSRRVDFDKPRYFMDLQSGEILDNRSGFEQLLELLSAADCGVIPHTGGKRFAEVLIDLLADYAPKDVCHLIDNVLRLLGVGRFSTQALVIAALDKLGCDGQKLFVSLSALDSLAKSGLLEVYMPLARIFQDRGQIRTLLDLLQVAVVDLQKGDAGDRGQSILRGAMPTLARVLRSEVVDQLFDLDDLLVTIPAVDGSGTLADVVVDSFEFLVRDWVPVETRRGVVLGTSNLLEILRPLRQIIDRLAQAKVEKSLQRVFSVILGYLKPDSLGQHLADPRIFPLLQNMLSYLAEAFEHEPESVRCFFHSLQLALDELIGVERFQEFVALMRTFANAPDSRAVDAALMNLLTPNASEPHQDAFPPMTQVISATIQTQFDDIRFKPVLKYFGQALQDGKDDAPGMLQTLDSLVNDDPHKILLTMARSLFRASGGPGEPQAFDVLFSLLSEIGSMDEQGQCTFNPDEPWTLPESESSIRAIADFLTDPRAGMPAIYQVISYRSHR